MASREPREFDEPGIPVAAAPVRRTKGRSPRELSRIRGLRRGLPERRERFARAWVETGNGAESARRAGYTGSPNVVCATACGLLKDAKVQARIAELMEAAGMVRDAVQVVSFVSRVAASGSERTQDRLRAADLLGKYHAIWTDVQVVRELPRDPARLRELIAVELARIFGADGLIKLAEQARDLARRGLPAPGETANAVIDVQVQPDPPKPS